VLPDGCIDVLVLGHGGPEAARVVGTMKRAFVAPPRTGAIFGIRFRPGEAARLLPAASRELTDGEAPLASLWGDEGRALEAALVELLDHAVARALTAEQILARARAVVEATLRKRLASHAAAVDTRVRAAAGMLASSDGMSVGEVAKRVELSERQLARRFNERVGVAPKTFARVMRLQRAAALLADGSSPSDAASLAGYADQAHFTRDSSELAGITPSGLARELSDSFNTDLAVAS
jgi:AraC-like DNA-binding protein